MTAEADTSDPRPPLRVVAAVITDDDMVLACRRRPGRPAGGKWEFPGGKVESDEDDADALRREIAEELRIRIEVGELLTVDDTVVGRQIIRLVCFRASLIGAAPDWSSDHDELRWAAREDLRTLEWAEPDLPVVHLLLSEVD